MLELQIKPRVMTVTQLIESITDEQRDGWIDDVISQIDGAGEEDGEDNEVDAIVWTDERRKALTAGLWWALRLIEGVGLPAMKDRGPETQWTPITVIGDPEED